MGWRHYEGRGTGNVSLLNGEGANISAIYESGLVLTGRSRVFAGYYVRVTLPSETEFTGEDEHSLRSALLRLASNLAAGKLILTCSGLDPRWRQSGLSENTGWGYFPFYPEAVHMMSPIPESVEHVDELDREIREAVSDMRIGIDTRQ